MTDGQDILKQGGDKLPEEKLLAYFEGTLSPEEQHEVECWLADEGMEADALEGLHKMPVNEAKATSALLNRQLQKDLSKKKSKRKTATIKNNPWAWVAVVIILLLAILGYVMLRLAVKR